MLGHHPQAGGATVHGVELLVKREHMTHYSSSTVHNSKFFQPILSV